MKDTRDNLEAFVARNLAAGADHMFLFADDGGAELAGWDCRHATVVATDETYWGGAPPESLNLRQRVNANVANALLAPFDVDWLFHIDSDECLDIDLDALALVETRLSCVRLATLEAVSRRRWPGGEVTHFKRLLDYEDLCLLHALGIIESPSNAAFFNGHVAGKVGIRPSPEIVLEIHNARDRDGAELEAALLDGSHVVHYESHCEAEFVRKWSVHLSSGGAAFKPAKDRLRAAIESITASPDLDARARERYLHELYVRLVEDDFDRLVELGFAVTLAPGRHQHRPQEFDPGDHDQLTTLLKRLVTARKPGAGAPWVPSAAQLLSEIAGPPAATDPDALSRRINACLEKTRRPAVVTPMTDLARDF